MQTLNQLHNVGSTLLKPFEFLHGSPAKHAGTQLALRMPLRWIGARIKVKRLPKCFVEPGAVGLWQRWPLPGELFHPAELWDLGLKGRKEWCLPKDLTNYGTEAPVYSQDVHRRKTLWDCNRARQCDVFSSRPLHSFVQRSRCLAWRKPRGSAGEENHGREGN